MVANAHLIKEAFVLCPSTSTQTHNCSLQIIIIIINNTPGTGQVEAEGRGMQKRVGRQWFRMEKERKLGKMNGTYNQELQR